jgi:hypothetical protein
MHAMGDRVHQHQLHDSAVKWVRRHGKAYDARLQYALRAQYVSSHHVQAANICEPALTAAAVEVCVKLLHSSDKGC